MGNYDGYSIEYEAGENEKDVVLLSKSHANQYILEDLLPGTEYTFRLASYAGTESNYRTSLAIVDAERTCKQFI